MRTGVGSEPPGLALETIKRQEVAVMTRLPKSASVPTEFEEQCVVVEYLEARSFRFTAIPNSTWTPSKAVVGKNMQSGLRPGLCDIVIVLPGRGLLWIEMKRLVGGVVSPAQQEWIDVLNTLPGNAAHICYGAAEAIAMIESYAPIGSRKHSPAPSDMPPTKINRGENLVGTSMSLATAGKGTA